MHSNATKVRHRPADDCRKPGKVRRAAASGERIRIRVALRAGEVID